MTHGGGRSRVLRVVSCVAIAAGIALVGTVPVAAECNEFDRWPSFRDRAAESPRVVFGRVVHALSRDSADHVIGFRLRVQEVIRGSAGETLEFDGIRPPGPLICSDSVLRVRVGDVLALAFQATTGDDVHAVAYVEGRPSRDFMPGMERLSVAEVRRLLADLPPTDAPVPGAASGTDASIGSQSGLVAGVLAAVMAVGWLRWRRRPVG